MHSLLPALIIALVILLATPITASNKVERILQLDTCADTVDPDYSFILDGGGLADCSYLQENPIEIANYCDRIHVKYACPATCLQSQRLACICPEDETEYTFPISSGRFAFCKWIDRRASKIDERRNDYCYKSEQDKSPSEVGEHCVSSCGFCRGTFSVSSNSPSFSPPITSPSNVPTYNPSHSPSSSPIVSEHPSECIDEPSWKTSTDGLTCSQIEQLILYESVNTSLDGYDYCRKFSDVIHNGKSIIEACCICGGSVFQRVAPSVSPSASAVPSIHPSQSPTECANEPGWEVHQGVTCDDIEKHMREIKSFSWCKIFSSKTWKGKSVYEACCTCGGSDYKTIVPSEVPTDLPTVKPSASPSVTPSSMPSALPSTTPSVTPSLTPSAMPSATPSYIPSSNPSSLPNSTPSTTPTASPSTSSAPSATRWIKLGNDFDGQSNFAYFGDEVSISTDGTIIAIGTSNVSGGLIKVYKWGGNGWSRIGGDIVNNKNTDFSARSVSLSGDGKTIASGAYQNTDDSTLPGRVIMYRWNGSSWNQIGGDISGINGGTKFGYSSSLSRYGSTVAIGTPFYQGNAGYVRVYEYSTTSNSWSQFGNTIVGDAGTSFGYSVSIAGGGAIVAVGAPALNGGTGRVRIFWRVMVSDGSYMWFKDGADILGQTPGDRTGYSVSLSESGSIVAIGSPFHNGAGGSSGNNVRIGRVRVFQKNLNSWIQLGRNIDGYAPYSEFGASVSLSDDGFTLAVGSPSYGNVDVYRYIGNDWYQIGGQIRQECFGDIAGSALSLSGDGTTVLIGAPLNPGTNNCSGGIHRGHARVYTSKN